MDGAGRRGNFRLYLSSAIKLSYRFLMLSISESQLEEVARIIGADGASDGTVETRVLALVQDPMLARRVIDWLPEAFAMVLIPHMGAVTLPTTFSAKNKSGNWVELDFRIEPIFHSAILLATQIFHNGPQDTFRNIVHRSALLATVSRALNEGASLDGATLSGPALIGVPAEVYPAPTRSIWRKLFR